MSTTLTLIKESPCLATAILETRTNAAGKPLGTRLHFGMDSDASRLSFATLKEKLVTATGKSKTQAKKEIEAMLATGADFAKIQAKIALELDLARGNFAIHRDESTKGKVSYVLNPVVTPKAPEPAVEARRPKTREEKIAELARLTAELEAYEKEPDPTLMANYRGA